MKIEQAIVFSILEELEQEFREGVDNEHDIEIYVMALRDVAVRVSQSTRH